MKRCVVCGKALGKRGELLYYRPDGSGVYLCGRKACSDRYNA